MVSHSLGITLAFLSALVVAGYVLLARKAMTAESGGTASEVVVVVLLVAAVVHGLAGFAFSYRHYDIGAKSLLAFIGAGIFGSLLGRRFLLESVSRLGAARADSIKASMPLFSFIWAITFLNEQFTVYNIMGIIAIAAGVVLVAWRRCSRSTAYEGRGRARDWLLPVVAAAFYSAEPVCARIGLLSGVSVMFGLAIQSLAAAAVYLGYLLITKTFPKRVFCSGAIGWAVLAGVASSSFLFLYNGALSLSPVVLVAPIIQISPLLVVGFSLLLLRKDERVTPLLILGAILTVGGAIAISS